jgi:tetratricopeptide (TPR) repeat protein
MQWMERLSEEWLMIFDDCNLDDRKGHLPGRGKGNIIYTSRRTSLNQDLPIDCTYEVTPFGEADAIELLSKASGFPSASENPRERGLAEAIVRELECLPLAVEKAAAYIRDGSYSLQEYLETLRAEKVRILSDPRPEDEEEDIKNSAVYAALELSYQAIASRRRREGRSGAGHTANFALKVLSLLTFFHHKEFPSLLMQRAADEYHAAGAPRYFPLSHLMSPYDYDLDRMVRAKEDGHWDSRDFVSGVTILRKFSLVKLSPDKKSLSMHVLVHRWARKRMEKDIALRWALVARVLLLESLDPAGRLGYLEFSRRLLPHFEVCFAVNPPLYLIRDQYRAHLLHKLGEYYRNQKRFVEAKECFSQSHRLWKIEVGADCWAAIDVAISLARLHHEMGNLSEAESAYLDAISWLSGKLAYRKAVMEAESEKEAGEEDEPERARRLSKASVKSAMKGFAGKPSKHRSVGIRSSVPFPSRKQPSKAEGMKRPSEPNIPNGDILDRKLRRAEHMEELDKIDIEDNLVHAELAMVYMDQDRYGMGKRMFLKAVGLLEQQLDKYNPDLMKLQVKARTLTHARDRESWENYMDDVLQAPQDTTALFWQSEAAFDLMIAATNSLLMSDTEDWALACRQLFSLHDAGIKSYGYCDRKILKILRYIVECLVTGGKYDNAAQMANTCLRRARSTYGELHMETIRSYVTLTSALIYQKLEFDDEGREILQGAVEKARAGLGSAHSLTQTLERHLRELSEKVEVPVRPESELLDPEAALMESWRQSKARLESDRAVLGDQHPIIKRMELMVGDGPARTKEEMLERVRVGYGPHNSFTKRLERELEESRRAASAQNPEITGDSERISLEPSGSNAPRGDGTGSPGESLRQPLQLMNEMTRARHTALGSKDSRFEKGEPGTAGHISLDGLIRDFIENELPDGVVSVDDRASGDSVGYWMSGALQPVLVV